MDTQSSNYKTRWVILLLLINTAWLLALTVGGASRNAPAGEVLKELRVRSLTVVDEGGCDRISLNAVEGGNANLYFYDLKGKLRIELSASRNGFADLRLLPPAFSPSSPNQFPEITISSLWQHILIEDDMHMTTTIKADGLKTLDLLIPALEAQRRLEAGERAAQKKTR